MKKVVRWAAVAAWIAFVTDWAVLGVKLLDHNYDVTAEAYIGLACLLVIVAYGVSKPFTDRCPHCGKIQMVKGKYCPHCGKEV